MRETTIEDRNGKNYTLRFDEEDEQWKFQILDEGTQVALAECECQNQESLYLSSIETYCIPVKKEDNSESVRNCQELGLGSVLLESIIQEARSRKFQQITGNLLSPNLKQHPELPAWYAKRNFLVTTNPDKTQGTILLKLFEDRKA
jgi:hypothetical protein